MRRHRLHTLYSMTSWEIEPLSAPRKQYYVQLRLQYRRPPRHRRQQPCRCTASATLATVNSSVGYWAFGGLRMITLGNGLTETTAYNSRLQPCRMNVNSSGSWYNLCSAAVPTGSVQDFTYGSASARRQRQPCSMSATGARTFSRTYSYGQLNRSPDVRARRPSGCTGLSDL